MSTPTQPFDLGALPLPELGRRPRRRRSFVILLFAAGAFAVAALCVAGYFSDATQNSPEAMAAMAFIAVGGMALVAGFGLIGWGLATLHDLRVVYEAAWLEDPTDRAFVRWWDGRAWTEHTSPRDPAVVELAPLKGRSTKRRIWGAALLVGAAAALLASQWRWSARLEQMNDAGLVVPEDGGPLDWVLTQLSSYAPLVGVVGLFFLLTLAPEPAAGWKPDPLDAARMRWWDGRSWTDLVQHREAA